MSQTPNFINRAVLKRLEEGSFVPLRKTQPHAGQSERRKILSPLSVTRRCIRYEPKVFSHRLSQILQMAHALNDATSKILLVDGAQGTGKTSLARGLIELMGGHAERKDTPDPQVLWFEANRHTDLEEIIQFLIQGITELCDTKAASGPFSPDRRMDRSRTATPSGEDPLKRLEKGLQHAASMPLFLVLDNVEFIVDANLRLNSPPFKELLNFLLARPNIKMALIGERLPYADMSPNQEGVLHIRLEGLTEADTLEIWRRKSAKTEPNHDPAILEESLTDEADSLKQLYHKTKGIPWLVKAVTALHQHAGLSFSALNRSLKEGSEPSRDLVQLVYECLPTEAHRRLLQTLCFLRHPVNTKALYALNQACFPLIEAGTSGEAANITDLLEHPLIRPLLKVSFPPQQVLNQLRNRAESRKTDKFSPWFELYLSVKQALYQTLPPAEQARIHDVLQDFYLKDKSNEAEQRILRIKNRAMLAEARYHGGFVRLRGDSPGKADSAASISSKAYVYQQSRPLGGSRKTLDDYRRIQIPDEPVPGLLEGTSNPVQIGQDDENPAIVLPPASFTDILASLEDEPDPDDTHEREMFSLEQLMAPKTHPPLPPQKSEAEPENTAPSLTDLQPHLLAESHLEVEERLIQQRLTAAALAHDNLKMAKELLALAQYRFNHGRPEEALRCLDKAVQLQPGQLVLAEIHQLYGGIHKARYQYNAASAALTKAISHLEPLILLELTDPDLVKRLSKAYQDLGEIQAYRKQYREAVESLRQAIHWAERAGEDHALGELAFQLAGAYEALGHTREAIQAYENAIKVDEHHHNLPALAATLANLGNLHLENGRPELAIDCLKRSLEYDRQLNEVEGQLTTLELLAQVYHEHQNQPQAEQTARQGLSLAVQNRLTLWQARFYTLLGQWAEEQAQWRQALQHYERARSCGEAELSKESLYFLDEVIAGLKTRLR
jgi:tetratricopeptide (TPR) repeat protein